MSTTDKPAKDSKNAGHAPNGDRAIPPASQGPGTPKGPKQPSDTTRSGDAKDGTGEDNHQPGKKH